MKASMKEIDIPASQKPMASQKYQNGNHGKYSINMKGKKAWQMARHGAKYRKKAAAWRGGNGAAMK